MSIYVAPSQNILDSILRETSLATSFDLRGGVSEVDEEADHREDEDAEHENLARPGLPRDQLPRPVLGLGVDVTGWHRGALLRSSKWKMILK